MEGSNTVQPATDISENPRNMASTECSPAEDIFPKHVSTTKPYLEDTYMFELQGVRFIEAQEDAQSSDEGSETLVFDRTIFHPQGGGQPADVGTVQSTDGSVAFKVDMVKEDRSTGIVYHHGSFQKGGRTEMAAASDMDQLTMVIDPLVRKKCAVLHSGGHALVVACTELGLDLKPMKGHHFPDGPYVMFEGTVKDKATLLDQLTEKMQEIAVRADSTLVKYATQEEANALNPDLDLAAHADSEKIRMVNIAGGAWFPCGGTHVRDSSELGNIVCTRIKSKKQNIKISYAASVVEEDECEPHKKLWHRG